MIIRYSSTFSHLGIRAPTSEVNSNRETYSLTALPSAVIRQTAPCRASERMHKGNQTILHKMKYVSYITETGKIFTKENMVSLWEYIRALTFYPEKCYSIYIFFRHIIVAVLKRKYSYFSYAFSCCIRWKIECENIMAERKKKLLEKMYCCCMEKYEAEGY